MAKQFLLGTGLMLCLAFCAYAEEPAASSVPKAAETSFSLKSPSFNDGEQIPEFYTCKGGDVNPALQVLNVPKGTRSLALTVVDPDNPIMLWTHWLVYNIHPGIKEIRENSVPGTQALNDFGNFYFGGPCVFDAKEHRFIFTLYALNAYLDDVTEGATRDILEKAMQGKVIAKTTLTGLYQNPLWGKDDKSL